MLHLVIPARNESKYIADTIRRLCKSLSDLSMPWQIIVADNGSTDQTADAVKQCMMHNAQCIKKQFNNAKDNPDPGLRTPDCQIEYLSCPTVGKGAAIRHAANQLPITNYQLPMQGASGINDIINSGDRGPLSDAKCESEFRVPNSEFKQYFGYIDADLSADPDAISGMVARLQSGAADIVIASRLLITKTTNRSWLRTLSSKLFNLASNLALHLDVADAQCGLKIMNSRSLSVLRDCQEDGWFLDIELLARARKAGLRIAEVPVPWTEFRYPNRASQINHLRDGIGAIKAVLQIKRNLRTSYIVHRTKD
ncbi:MAG: glycosyltransferase [Patescibacteria group bacterium]